MTRLPRRFWVLFFFPAALVIGGSFGYHFIEEEYTLFDGLYMTIITLVPSAAGSPAPSAGESSPSV